MLRRSLLAPLLLAAPLALGCSPDFEPASTLNTLRVLAVQKDKPYARPGETVTLTMLYDDASVSASGSASGSASRTRPVQLVWLGGFCENPLGDSYAGCFVPKPGAKQSAPGPYGFPAGVVVGTGPTFRLPLSRTIISSRPPPANRKQPPYGVSFVFFAACAGSLEAAPDGEAIPVACYSSSGDRLGANDFVVGYTEVFASDAITNANPIVTGFEVDDQSTATDCTGPACVPIESESSGGDAGLPSGAAPSEAGALVDGGLDSGGTKPASNRADGGFVPAESDPCAADPPTAACIDVCTKEKQDDCPKHTIKVLTDPASEELDGVATALEGHDIFEQMWVNYYTEQGKIPVQVKLLGDATLGYNPDHGTKILAPKKTGVFHVWAVAHDSRGGVQWTRVRLSARCPEDHTGARPSCGL